jgi:hypothetical protein
MNIMKKYQYYNNIIAIFIIFDILLVNVYKITAAKCQKIIKSTIPT